MGPTLGFNTAKNTFWSNLVVFFTIKTRFWQYYSLLNMRKSQSNEQFLVLLGPIISRCFECSNEEKNKPKTTKGACSSPISMLTKEKHSSLFCHFVRGEEKKSFFFNIGTRLFNICRKNVSNCFYFFISHQSISHMSEKMDSHFLIIYTI